MKSRLAGSLPKRPQLKAQIPEGQRISRSAGRISGFLSEPTPKE